MTSSTGQNKGLDEDAFLWDEETPSEQVGQLGLSEAEQVALHLFEFVSLPSALNLEDPNERFVQYLGNEEKLAALQQSRMGRIVSSDDLANHMYELTPDGGRVGFETNPKNIPALARLAVEHGRRHFLLPGLLKILRSLENVSVKPLQPLEMTEPLDPSQMGNYYFRLVTDPAAVYMHDVACLLTWMEPEHISNLVELLAWPIEKAEPASA